MRRLRHALPVAALLAALACGEDDVTAPDCGAVSELELEPSEPVTFVRLMTARLVEVQGVSECGTPVTVAGEAVTWSSSAPGVASVEPVDWAGGATHLLRAVSFGTATVSATARGITAELPVEVTKPETEGSGFTVQGSGGVAPYTTDLWVHGEHAYTGSQPWSCPDDVCVDDPGWLFVWRLMPDGGIEKGDSVALPAPKVNDVKVSPDGSFAVASLERGGPDNGIVVLELADPSAPALRSHYTTRLQDGVHNVWIERLDGRDYVFAAVAHGAGAGIYVVDVTDRDAPEEVAFFYGGESLVHDVYVRDGLAFVSHWDAGLVILDVGNGIAGGAPHAPVEVSRVVTEGGNVHNAWYWPEGEVVFVGEEQFPPPDQIDQVGVMHVVDVSDLTAPVEVAHFGVPGVTAHNFWLDEERGILFAAWYEAGLRAIDVTGELAGDLAQQGRERGWILPSGVRGAGSVWAPQMHEGRIYASDIFNGIWSVRFDG